LTAPGAQRRHTEDRVVGALRLKDDEGPAFVARSLLGARADAPSAAAPEESKNKT
jgi:hypothetical protein